MPKQFLLNLDGSIPPNANVKALEKAGIPLVLPTPMPRQSGMIAVEQEPQQIDGIWKQVWTLEPVSDESPEE